MGFVTKFWCTDWPETASFLTEDERALLIARLSADTGDAVMNRIDKRAARRIFSDPKIYLGVLAYFGQSPRLHRCLIFRANQPRRYRQHRLRRLLLRPNHC